MAVARSNFSSRQQSRKSLIPQAHGAMCKPVPLKKRQGEEKLQQKEKPQNKLIQAEKAETGNVSPKFL